MCICYFELSGINVILLSSPWGTKERGEGKGIASDAHVDSGSLCFIDLINRTI
jgi:hypothetical protein